jgi:glycosyltransferase involved in cell wall biosynthesis
VNRLLYVQYTNPAEYPPLEHSSRIFARTGWELLFLGTASMTGDTIRFTQQSKVMVHLLPFCNGGWRQKLHYAGFALWVLYWVLRWRPHWVYASDVLACPVALLLSFLPGIKLVYHEHDAPSPTARRSAPMRLSIAARTWLARRATLCVLPNQPRAEQFAARLATRSPVVCVWNCPSLEEVGPPRAARVANQLAILYHGSIVPARVPLTIIQALAELPDDVTLCVVGFETVGHLGYSEQIRSEARRLGLAHRVTLVPPIPTRAELLSYCRQADVGLSLMPTDSNDPNLQLMVGASNKPFDYLACGLALLVSDLPIWRQEYVDPEYGLACDPDDPASIASALRWFLDHPEKLRAMGERGRQRVATEWNYEHQFAPVLARTRTRMRSLQATA